MLTFASTSPKALEPTVEVAKLSIRMLEGYLTVASCRAPFPSFPVAESRKKLSLPHSPATGVQGEPMKTLGHRTGPTVLSRRLVIVAPPAVASSVEPWNVIGPAVFTTAVAGRGRMVGMGPPPGGMGGADTTL